MQLRQVEFVRREIRAGEAAIAAGKLYTANEVKAHLEAKRKIRKNT